ncbi:MAG: FG-GAP repeat protein [Planctomycetes bacterium]|nr:FG-GAP repeat protein [Planctomycetota bacterium]
MVLLGRLSLAFLAVLVCIDSTDAQCRVDKVAAGAPKSFARFGQSVAISGGRMIVGSPNYKVGALTPGAAHIYALDATGWNLQATLFASDAADFDDFGISVAIDGDRILVGADSVDGPLSGAVGAVYAFDWNGTQWQEVQKFQASDGASGAFFGCSVALRGDRAVIGRFWDSPSGAHHAGSAYVFARNGATWSEEQKLVASNATREDNFGWSVALSDTRVVVGAPERFDNMGANFTQFGQVYVFEKLAATWTETAILTEGNRVQWDQLGISVAIDHDQIIAGAWADNFSPPISGVGSAHVFQWNGSAWTESILQASDPEFEGEFGASVAIQGPWAVIGTPSRMASFPLWGAVYFFHHDASGWTQTDMQLPDPSSSLGWLGMSAAIDGNYAVAGAPIETTAGSQDGAVYVFGGFAPWKDEGFALAGVNGDPVLTGNGSLCGGTNTSIVLTNAKAKAGAVLITGPIEVNLPFFGGTLVPQPKKIFRGLKTDTSGSLTLNLAAATLPPGTAAFYQAWIRDPVGPQGFSASNGISGVSP